MWEFSGYEPYYLVYDHFIGDPNCLHVVVFNLEDTQDRQLQHVLFWLNFIQARIAPMEPIGTVHFCYLCSWVLPPSSLLDMGEVRFSVVVPLIQFLALYPISGPLSSPSIFLQYFTQLSTAVVFPMSILSSQQVTGQSGLP